jgi:hypothetical protein
LQTTSSQITRLVLQAILAFFGEICGLLSKRVQWIVASENMAVRNAMPAPQIVLR